MVTERDRAVLFGKPSRNIKTIWSTILTVTPAISFGLTGGFRADIEKASLAS